jgi:hypothetical protein
MNVWLNGIDSRSQWPSGKLLVFHRFVIRASEQIQLPKATIESLYEVWNILEAIYEKYKLTTDPRPSF